MPNERFIKLLTKEFSRQLTEAEQEELQQLLHTHPKYREQKAILEEYWKKDQAQYAVNAAMFKKVQDKISAEEEHARSSAPDNDTQQPKRPWSTAARYSVAATIILAFASIILLVHTARTPKQHPQTQLAAWQQKSTRPTARTTIILSDSTVIRLNSATTIKYPASFTGSVREVYLDGEAYFDVAKDAEHPFIIHTSKMNIKVLGTAFNIKSYPTEPISEATLIKGSIEVTLNDRPSDRIILKPKEKLIVQNQNNTAVKKHTDETSPKDSVAKDTRYSLTNLTYFRNEARTVVETSWIDNKLFFSDEQFQELSGQLERWYGVRIEFASEKIKEYRFTGFFEKETLPEALDALRMIEHFSYRIKNSTVYIY